MYVGFYVKTGQIISTRIDIFPKQYTTKLALTQDNLDPLPASGLTPTTLLATTIFFTYLTMI